MVKAVVNRTFLPLCGIWIILTQSTTADPYGAPDRVLTDDLYATLFEVSPRDLVITRDIVLQFQVDDTGLEHGVTGLKVDGPDANWLSNLQQDEPPVQEAEPPPSIVPQDAMTPPQPQEVLVSGSENEVLVSTPTELTDGQAVGSPSESNVVIPLTAPDPGPLGFLGLGLIALALIRKRRRNPKRSTAFNAHEPVATPL